LYQPRIYAEKIFTSAFFLPLLAKPPKIINKSAISTAFAAGGGEADSEVNQFGAEPPRISRSPFNSLPKIINEPELTGGGADSCRWATILPLESQAPADQLSFRHLHQQGFRTEED